MDAASGYAPVLKVPKTSVLAITPCGNKLFQINSLISSIRIFCSF